MKPTDFHQPSLLNEQPDINSTKASARIPKPTKELKACQLLVECPHGLFDTDIIRYCGYTKGHSCMSKLRNRHKVNIESKRTFNPLLGCKAKLYRITDQRAAEQLLSYIQAERKRQRLSLLPPCYIKQVLARYPEPENTEA